MICFRELFQDLATDHEIGDTQMDNIGSTSLSEADAKVSHVKIAAATQETIEEEVESLAEQVFNPYTELKVFQGHSDIVRILLKIDDAKFASASDDNTAVIWNMKTAQKISILCGHTRPVACMLLLAPSSDGFEDPMLVTGSSDKQIKVWDIENGDCIQTILDHMSSVRSLVSLESGELFCSGGKKLCVWTRKGELLSSTLSLNDEDINLMVAIKNNRVVTAADKQLCVYVVVKTENSLTSENDSSWELTLVKKLPPHREVIRCLINVSDASFASGSIDGTIILWTTQTLAPSRYFNSIPDYQGREHLYPYSIQHMICVDERYIVAGIGSGFCVYDTVSGSVLMTKAKAHYSKVLFVGFVWENTFLATCSEDGSLRLWGHSQTLQLAQQDNGQHGDSILTKFTGYSTDYLRHCRGEGYLMELRLMGECLGHSGAVQMFLDYDEHGVISCGVDSLIIAWKNSEIERMNRTDMLREMFMGAARIV